MSEKNSYTYTIDKDNVVEIFMNGEEVPVTRQHRAPWLIDEEKPELGYADWANKAEAEKWVKGLIAELTK